MDLLSWTSVQDRAESSQNQFFFSFSAPKQLQLASFLASHQHPPQLHLFHTAGVDDQRPDEYSSAISTAIMRHSLADSQIVPADQLVEQHHDHLDSSVQ